jgi:hypothetical protein
LCAEIVRAEALETGAPLWIRGTQRCWLQGILQIIEAKTLRPPDWSIVGNDVIVVIGGPPCLPGCARICKQVERPTQEDLAHDSAEKQGRENSESRNVFGKTMVKRGARRTILPQRFW